MRHLAGDVLVEHVGGLAGVDEDHDGRLLAPGEGGGDVSPSSAPV